MHINYKELSVALAVIIIEVVQVLDGGVQLDLLFLGCHFSLGLFSYFRLINIRCLILKLTYLSLYSKSKTSLNCHQRLIIFKPKLIISISFKSLIQKLITRQTMQANIPQKNQKQSRKNLIKASSNQLKCNRSTGITNNRKIIRLSSRLTSSFSTNRNNRQCFDDSPPTNLKINSSRISLTLSSYNQKHPIELKSNQKGLSLTARYKQNKQIQPPCLNQKELENPENIQIERQQPIQTIRISLVSGRANTGGEKYRKSPVKILLKRINKDSNKIHPEMTQKKDQNLKSAILSQKGHVRSNSNVYSGSKYSEIEDVILQNFAL